MEEYSWWWIEVFLCVFLFSIVSCLIRGFSSYNNVLDLYNNNIIYDNNDSRSYDLIYDNLVYDNLVYDNDWLINNDI